MNPSILGGRLAFVRAFRIPLQDPFPHEAGELVVARHLGLQLVNHFSQRRVLDRLAVQIQLATAGPMTISPLPRALTPLIRISRSSEGMAPVVYRFDIRVLFRAVYQ